MLEVLQFYVSGFWTWAGLTIGLSAGSSAITATLLAIRGKK